MRQAILGLNATNFPRTSRRARSTSGTALPGYAALFGYQVMDRDPASPAPALTERRPGWFGLTRWP